MSTLTCRAVLFDLDGTLIDSTGRIHRLWQWWAARRGIPFESLLDVMHGRTAVETIRLAAPHLVPEDEIEELETEEIAHMPEVRLYPGALELLARLDGAPWAIVTSGSQRVADARISYVHLPPPPVLITANLVHEGKPAPEGYLLAARKLGVPPQDCIVLEDAPVGIEAGQAAGMRVIAIPSPYPREQLARADALVAHLRDLDLRVEAGRITIGLPLSPPRLPS